MRGEEEKKVLEGEKASSAAQLSFYIMEATFIFGLKHGQKKAVGGVKDVDGDGGEIKTK